MSLTIHELSNTRSTPKPIVIVEATVIVFGRHYIASMPQLRVRRSGRRMNVMVIDVVTVRVKTIAS